MDEGQGGELRRMSAAGVGEDVGLKTKLPSSAARWGPPPPVTAAGPDGVTTPAPGDTQHAGGATPTAYAVQVLAVKSASQVDEMLTRLKVMGFDAHVVRDTSGLFKVRVGRYATRGDAQQAQARLKTKLGGQPFLVEEP